MSKKINTYLIFYELLNDSASCEIEAESWVLAKKEFREKYGNNKITFHQKIKSC